MGKIAFVFSGQGDQRAAMCSDLYSSSPVFKATLERLDEIHPGLIDSIYSSTDEELMKTINTQPALYAVEIALANVLKELGIKADAVAGFSLGEIAALSYAGSYSCEEGMDIVSHRALFMQEDAEKTEAVMTAAMGLSAEKIKDIAERYEHVFAVNFNTPAQTVCSGFESEIESFEKSVKTEGGKCIRLKVKAGFHSPFMKNASERFSSFLEKKEIALPGLTTYSNYLGLAYEDSVKDILALQIKSPVLWHKCVDSMIYSGVDTFIEIGPGGTLSSLIKKINGDVRTFQSGCISAIEALKEALC